MKREIRIFISSPSDVREERIIAKSVIKKLNEEFRKYLTITPILWEDLPLDANSSFQEGIDCFTSVNGGIDIAIFILWSRMGSEINKFDENGIQYKSGTVYEFDTVMQSCESKTSSKKPLVLFYRKSTINVQGDIEKPDEFNKRINEFKEVEDFFKKNFFEKDGKSNKRAYTKYSKISEFEESIKEHLRNLIYTYLPNNSTGIVLWDGCPFKGLESFGINDESIFFGRDKAVNEIVKRIQIQEELNRSFVLIIGKSGCGKSSIICAGVLPRIISMGQCDNKTYRWTIFVPGKSNGDLCNGIWNAIIQPNALPELMDDTKIFDKFKYLFNNNTKDSVNLIVDKLTLLDNIIIPKSQNRLFLIIDQFEEIFTHDFTPENIDLFYDFLIYCSECGRIQIVASIRSDFYSYISEKLVKLKRKLGTYDLVSPKTSTELRSIISEPAKNAGINFQRSKDGLRTLEDEILDDLDFIVDKTNLLPHLEFTLTELYENRDISTNELTYESYICMGRISGSLVTVAERCFQSLSNKQKEYFPSFISSLITLSPDKDKRPIKKQASLLVVVKNPIHKEILDHFSKQRLVIIDNDSIINTPTVSFVHDTLIENWDRLKIWVNENRQHLENESFIQGQAVQWEKNKYANSYLIKDYDQMLMAEDLENNFNEHLEDETINYITASRKKLLRSDFFYWCSLSIISALFILISLLFPSFPNMILMTKDSILFLSLGLFIPSTGMLLFKFFNKPFYVTIHFERIFWGFMIFFSILTIILYMYGYLRNISLWILYIYYVPLLAVSILNLISKENKHKKIHKGISRFAVINEKKIDIFYKWIENGLLRQFITLSIFITVVGTVSTYNIEKEAKNRAVKSLLSSNVETFSKLLDATSEIIESALLQQMAMVRNELEGVNITIDTTLYSIYKPNSILKKYFNNKKYINKVDIAEHELKNTSLLKQRHKLEFHSDFFRMEGNDSILEPISFEEVIFKTPNNKIDNDINRQILNLSSSINIFKKIRSQGSNNEIFLWQYFGLKENGLFCSYPWHLLEDDNYDPRKRKWFIENDSINWRFYIFSSTKQYGFTCSTSFSYNNNKLGVCAIDLSLNKIVTRLLPSFVKDNNISVILAEAGEMGFTPMWTNDDKFRSLDLNSNQIIYSYAYFGAKKNIVKNIFKTKSDKVVSCLFNYQGSIYDCSVVFNSRLNLICIYMFNN